MTRKQRLLNAIRHRNVDRVPYATYNLHPYGPRSNQHLSDPSYQPLLSWVRDKAGAMIKVHVGGVGPGLSRARPEQSHVSVNGAGDDRMQTQVIHTPAGDLTSIRHAPENKPGYVVKQLVNSDEEMERYQSIPYESPDFDVSGLRAMYKSAGENAVLMVIFPEPMYSIASLMGFEDFSVRCLTDLETVLRWIDWAQERCMANLTLLLEACRGMDLLFHTSGPEICTPPMLSPALFPRLVTPSLTKLVDLIHDNNQLAAVHCHGHVREIFPEVLRSGADLLEPIEPPPQGNITLKELREQAGGRLCLMGHIQDQEFYSAAPGEMRRRVQEIADLANGQTGYIMTPTCTPFQHPCSEIYQRNYLEWLEAAETLLC